MKKTLLATAIAGALGASAAQAATVYNQDGTQVDLYGNVQLAYRSEETRQADGSVDSEDQLFDNGTTLGVAAQHQVNPGLVAYLKLELDNWNSDELKSRARTGGGDTSYAGLKGNFGDVKVGSFDTLYDDWVKDPVDGSWYAGVTNATGTTYVPDTVGNDDREGDQLVYKSPMFGGLQFALGTQFKGDAETENGSDGSNASFFGGVHYVVGALDLAAVYDNLDTYDYTDYDAGSIYGVSAQYAFNDAFTLAGKVSRFDGNDDTQGNTDIGVDGTGVENSDMYAVKLNYAYSMGNIYGTYQYVKEDQGDNDESYNQVMLGADYSLTPSVTYFVETTMYDGADDVGDFVGTGLAYTF